MNEKSFVDDTWSYGVKMPKVDIEFTDITYTVPTGRKSKKMILKGISGQFKCNELTGILGPSGSGKSTLLNILTGYTRHGNGGGIKVNGKLINMEHFKKMTCYIMQDDLLQPKLTVIEAMNFSADLKLGSSVTYEKKKIIIDKILKTLRLSNAENTIMERLSGGERKRLSIALELVNNPPVIFLDEPTTGLDELSSVQCINLLQKIALTGKTVVCSIHTPSANIFSKFHHVYIVASGQCVYRGPSNNIVPFLNDVGIECPKHYNPADFVIDVSSGEYGTKFIDNMISEVNEKYPIIPIEQSSTYDIKTIYQKSIKNSWKIQFCTLLKRMILQILRDKKYTWLKLVSYIFAGLVNAGIYYGIGNDGSKTMENVFFCYSTLFIILTIPIIPIPLYFPMEIQIMEREHFNRWYDINTYFFASTVSCLPLTLIISIIYSSLAYFITAQPLELFRMTMFYSTCIIIYLISETAGYIIGCIFKPNNGLFAAGVVTTISHLSAIQGFGSPEEIPLVRKIMMYMLPMRWSFEGSVSSVFGFKRENLICPDNIDYCPYKIPKAILKLGKLESADFQVAFTVLIFYWIILRILFYCALKQRLQPNAIFRQLNIKINLVKKHFNIS